MTAASDVLWVLMRWTHLASVALLIGGLAYARLVLFPALASVRSEERMPLVSELVRRYRPLIYSTIAGLLVSGVYRLLSERGHTGYYHMWFGIKMLIVAHIFVTGFLLAREPKAGGESRRARQMAGAVITGLIAILISAYLRRIY